MSSCAAANCQNRSDRGVVPGRSFHRLPQRNPALLKAWLSQMGRESWTPTPRASICSDHFEKVCFDRTGQTTRIRESAVPTLFNLPPNPKKKEIVSKFPLKKLRSGKRLGAPAPGVQAGSSHDHTYLGKGGFLNQEKLKSQSRREDMNNPLKKLRSGKQLGAPAPDIQAGSSHGHDYLGKSGFLNQEKLKSQSRREDMNNPLKKLRSGKQLGAPAPGIQAGSSHGHEYLGKGGFLNQEKLKSQSRHGDMINRLKKLRSGKQLGAPAPDIQAGSSHGHDYLGKGGFLNQEKLKSQSRHGDMIDRLKKLRSGKQLGAPAPGVQAGSSHDHDYPGKDNFPNQEKLKSPSQHGDMNDRTGPPRDRQSSDQDRFSYEEPVAGNAERQLPDTESQANALNNLKSCKQDGVLNEDKTKVNKEKQLPDKDSQIITLPDGHGYIKDGFFHLNKTTPISDISRNERKRINKIKQHDHSYSFEDNPVVLRHKMDVACTKLAEIRTKFKSHQQKNRRLSVKIKALTREVQELRDRQFVINNTFKFLESLEYRPDFNT